MDKPSTVAAWNGFCPVCRSTTRFSSANTWFRDYLECENCEHGSIPRERALFHVLHELAPNFLNMNIHESSPGGRECSVILHRHAKKYTPTQFYPGIEPGTIHNQYRCENIERQTFPDESFDIVITLDVMEHIFNPDAAYRDIYRTLRPGGYYIHTTPIFSTLAASERRAAMTDEGEIVHLFEPEYHGNPVDASGSLVTFHYGYDLPQLITEWTPFEVEIRRHRIKRLGLIAEFNEVIVCRKPD